MRMKPRKVEGSVGGVGSQFLHYNSKSFHYRISELVYNMSFHHDLIITKEHEMLKTTPLYIHNPM